MNAVGLVGSGTSRNVTLKIGDKARRAAVTTAWRAPVVAKVSSGPGSEVLASDNSEPTHILSRSEPSSVSASPSTARFCF